MTLSTSGCCRTTPTPGPNVTGGAPPTYQAETAPATAVRAWADEINALPGAPHTLRDLAASIRPLA